MSASIRRAVRADASALAHLHRRCFDAAWDEAAFRSLLDNHATRAYLARDAVANEVQGFIAIQIAADESEILSLGVVPQARGRGFAKALVAHAGADAHAAGARSMFLEVAADNAAARALYASLGFTETGRRAAYYGRGAGAPVDALCLRAALPL
jgi:ribosomal-protein-alanine N-acetyltransferase